MYAKNYQNRFLYVRVTARQSTDIFIGTQCIHTAIHVLRVRVRVRVSSGELNVFLISFYLAMCRAGPADGRLCKRPPMAKSMGNDKLWPPQPWKHLIDFDETWNLELPPEDHPPRKISFRSDDVAYVVSANTQFATVGFLCLYFLGLFIICTGCTSRPILMIYASPFRGQIPQNTFGAVNRHFQTKWAKSKIVYIIETTAPIPTNQVLHNNKDQQRLFAGGPNTCITNPLWRTAAILKKLTIAVSQQRFERLP